MLRLTAVRYESRLIEWGMRVSAGSNDIVASALCLLWRLDTFLAEMDAIRIDALPEADREKLYAAITAMSKIVNEVNPRRRTASGQIIPMP
jgi:hypothetical protein